MYVHCNWAYEKTGQTSGENVYLVLEEFSCPKNPIIIEINNTQQAL